MLFLLSATSHRQCSAQAPPTTEPAPFARADRLIADAVAAGKCPGAVLLVGRGDAIVYEKAYGNRSLLPAPAPMTTDTVFDLASLTKPVATASSIMLLEQRGKLKLDDPVAKYLPEFAQNGKAAITIEDLLLHIGGLIPDDDIADYANGRAAALAKIMAAAPAYPPRSRFAYSDVGYIVLGELIHHVDGRPLDQFAREEIFRPLGMRDTGFLPGNSLKVRCAPTEQRDGHWMIGEVHDPRAHALGGVAGHAGLFSTAEDLSKFCRMMLGRQAPSTPAPRYSAEPDSAKSKIDPALPSTSEPAPVSPSSTTKPASETSILSPSTLAEMTRPRPVPGGTRGLGLDIDTAYSSPRGDRFARGATFGHTGFTGVAFWIDPTHQCYYILLTNAVHPSGHGNVKQLRRDVATAVAEALLGK